MEGKFRKRANTVWCPRPRPAVIGTENNLRGFETGWKIGDIIIRAKKVTGWTNMNTCFDCPYLEEYHIEELGVFCTYPKIYSKLESDQNKEVKI